MDANGLPAIPGCILILLPQSAKTFKRTSHFATRHSSRIKFRGAAARDLGNSLLASLLLNRG